MLLSKFLRFDWLLSVVNIGLFCLMFESSHAQVLELPQKGPFSKSGPVTFSFSSTKSNTPICLHYTPGNVSALGEVRVKSGLLWIDVVKASFGSWAEEQRVIVPMSFSDSNATISLSFHFDNKSRAAVRNIYVSQSNPAIAGCVDYTKPAMQTSRYSDKKKLLDQWNGSK